MKTLEIELPDDLYRRLETIAIANGMNVSDVLVDLIFDWGEWR